MAALLNRARMTTATTGTGTVTLGSAVTGYASFAEAGAVNATVYSYCIEDGDDFEIGVGTYTSSGTTFSRDTVTLSKISGTSGTSKINLSGTAEIFITLRVADLAYQPLDADLTTLSTAFTTASASGPASLAFAEDTDNGAHAVTLKAPASVAANADVTLPGVAGTLSQLDVENQALTGGATVTSKDLGTQTTGTLTLDMGDRPLQHYTNGGAHTLAPGSVNGSCLVDITNNGSAGAITTSGWTKVAGDSFTTTNGHKFRCHASVGNGGSLLIVQALQ